jgi:hypothetical protein
MRPPKSCNRQLLACIMSGTYGTCVALQTDLHAINPASNACMEPNARHAGKPRMLEPWVLEINDQQISAACVPGEGQGCSQRPPTPPPQQQWQATLVSLCGQAQHTHSHMETWAHSSFKHKRCRLPCSYLRTGDASHSAPTDAGGQQHHSKQTNCRHLKHAKACAVPSAHPLRKSMQLSCT